MADGPTVRIEVAHALPERQLVVALELPPGTTAREAACRAGLDAQFPGLDSNRCPLGVFGRLVADGYRLREGDRLELYRPLPRDPRDARRDRLAAPPARGRG